MKALVGLAAVTAIVLAGPAAQASAATSRTSPATAPTAQAPPTYLWSSQAPATTIYYTRAAFWSKVLKYVGCAAGIGAAVLGNAALVLKLRKAGGVWKAAKRIWKASTREKKMAIVAAISGDISGVTGVVAACTE